MSYAELHAKSNFSFLEGASHPEELVRRAAELGYTALAVTDRNSLAGVVRAHVAAKEAGLKLVIGAEITPADAPPVVLWATDRAAYGRLARLITRGRRRAEKGQCRLLFRDVAEHAQGLLAGIVTNCKLQIANYKLQNTEGGTSLSAAKGVVSRGAQDPHPFPLTLALSRRERGPARTISQSCRSGTRERGPARALPAYRDLFGDRGYLLAELHYGGDDRRRLECLVRLSRRYALPLAAAGDVHYHVPQRQALGDVLTALRCGSTVAASPGRLFRNAQRCLKSPAEMAVRFAPAPQAICHALEIAGRTAFSLDELRYEYPEELAPPGRTPAEYLAEQTLLGARRRYPAGVPERIERLLEHELRLIEELHYEAYFLTVWDLVCFARRRGILCQGRGSAANSAVCFCLGITAVDPQRMDVLFERFVSRERNEAPDIDVDFEHERREEVLQYLYAKYGRERAGMTAEVITYRPRSAVRDVGRALGLPPPQIDRLARRLEHFVHGDCPNFCGGDGPDLRKGGGDGENGTVPFDEPDLPARCREAGLDPDCGPGRQLIELVGQLAGFPRHLSQHTGGMVITRGPLCELVPIENAAMPERTVIQWNKDDLDELGILKVDCLALGMLTALGKCFALVERHAGRRLTLADVPEGDAGVYAMICRADTMGVFQIESRAQMSMLTRLRPQCFHDLVIEVAIVRPGPIQGNMVHPYLRRRNGEEPVEYPNAVVRRVLEKTLGVPLFQEQAMRLAVEAAGFTPGEADQLRRAMGAWRRPGLIDRFRQKLLDGMSARGFSPQYAEAVFQQIRGFGEYGFPESHAASFALLVYVSAWLKCHYPAAFTAALLNSQPLGFYAPAQLVRNAREHGIQVLPADVNSSQWDCTLEGGGLSQFSSDENGTVPFKAEGGRGKAGDCPDFRPTKMGLSPSRWKAEGAAVRLGFRMINGLGRACVEQIVRARGEQEFRSLDDFARRTQLSRPLLVRLAHAGTFGSLGLDRRQSLWHALEQDQQALPLFPSAAPVHPSSFILHPSALKGTVPFSSDENRDSPPPSSLSVHPSSFILHPSALPPPPSAVPLPPMSLAEEMLADYRTTGLSLRAHPLQFLRGELDRWGVVPAAGLNAWPDGKPVRVAGLVLVRQRPSTAKGITFVTLEDETGTVNLIVRPAVWRRYRTAAMGATLLVAHGPLQRQHENIHVLVACLEDLSLRLPGMDSQSRDFA
ncbi:MAG: error-prone DNA polymerase [Thermoguttaceae bacterium]|jgi:error-prone DNA polymerase